MASTIFATIEDDKAALLTRQIIGEDNLLWGSDYPHVDSTWPCSVESLVKCSKESIRVFVGKSPMTMSKDFMESRFNLVGLSRL